jgi:hypothetical protein
MPKKTIKYRIFEVLPTLPKLNCYLCNQKFYIMNIAIRISAIFLFLLFAPSLLSAQGDKRAAKDEEADFKNEFALAIGLQGRKANFSAYYGRIISPYRSWIFNLDITEVKAEKERRNSTGIFSTPNTNNTAYVYGKRNSFYLARLGAGQKIYISEKNSSQSLTVAFSYQGGFTLGALKPYYLQLIYRTDSTYRPSTEAYSEENQSVFLNPNNIVGAGGFRLGWDAVKIRPGFFVKTALWIELGSDTHILGALEFGTIIDAFAQPIPILALSNSSPVMFHLYANFYFGGRW